MIALEMANLLKNGGQRIASLVLMEPPYPGERKPPVGFRITRRMLRMTRHPAEGLRYALSKMPWKVQEPGIPTLLGAGNGSLLRAMGEATAGHAFAPYPGRVTLLMGKDSERRYVYMAIWREILTGRIDSRLVSGSHNESFFGEDLTTFFRDALDE